MLFELYLIKEFQRLKEQEHKSIEWSAKRELAKVNYRIQTSAIKNNLIVPELTKDKINYVYASEADLLNVALFGITAGEWRKSNLDLKGNIRDYTDLLHLVILNNLQNINAELIENNIPQSERLIRLNNSARR